MVVTPVKFLNYEPTQAASCFGWLQQLLWQQQLLHLPWCMVHFLFGIHMRAGWCIFNLGFETPSLSVLLARLSNLFDRIRCVHSQFSYQYYTYGLEFNPTQLILFGFVMPIVPLSLLIVVDVQVHSGILLKRYKLKKGNSALCWFWSLVLSTSWRQILLCFGYALFLLYTSWRQWLGVCRTTELQTCANSC